VGDELNLQQEQSLKKITLMNDQDREIWINPFGGLGDTVILSGVLKLVFDRNPSRRFNLVRRTPHLSVLAGHPAISRVGYPPRGAIVLGTDYWRKERVGAGMQRPFQILARLFGLSTPVEERPYLPEGEDRDPLQDFIPWKKRNILIAPASVSPKKEMDGRIWRRLVEMFRQDGAFVAQAGKLNNTHIANAYSLLGLTTPKQLMGLLKRFDLLITVDNFIMHAAYPAGIDTVVLWGPTDSASYGYPTHLHLQAPRTCGPEFECPGPTEETAYETPCPFGSQHCMNRLAPEAIHEAPRSGLSGLSGKRA
jgi:ADP-heptose:LPS heptosyltransferase